MKQPSYLFNFHCNFVLHNTYASHNHIAHPLSFVLSYQHCVPSYHDFCCSISTHFEPKTYKQASQHDFWKQAMEIELLSLIKIILGLLLIFHQVRVLVVAGGFTKSNIEQMAPLKYIKPYFSPKATLSSKKFISVILSLMLTNLQ